MSTKIKVEGMSCGHCKMHVEKAALSIEGVKSAEVNLDKGELTLDAPESLLDQVKAAVNQAGYKA